MVKHSYIQLSLQSLAKKFIGKKYWQWNWMQFFSSYWHVTCFCMTCLREHGRSREELWRIWNIEGKKLNTILFHKYGNMHLANIYFFFETGKIFYLRLSYKTNPRPILIKSTCSLSFHAVYPFSIKNSRKISLPFRKLNSEYFYKKNSGSNFCI